MRLVSLWWEFPPRLDSNINIQRSGLQQFFVEPRESFLPSLVFHFLQRVRTYHFPTLPLRKSSYPCFCTVTPVQSSKTRMVEQKSSSPEPQAMAARIICAVSAVAGSGTFIAFPVSRANPTSLAIHFRAKLVWKSRLKINGAL